VNDTRDSLRYKLPWSYEKERINALFSASPFICADAITFLNYYHWHSKDERTSFHLFNDYTEYLQVDKFKHAYGSYLEGYVAYNLMMSYGIKRSTALIFGGAAGFFIQTPKEFFDGLYTSSGFSWSDVAANALGSVLFVGQELIFNEQVVNYKFSFSRSEYTNIANGYLGDNLIENYFEDYNGHTYWLTMNANKIFLKKLIPGWINLAIGYSANGMIGKFHNIDSYHGVQIPYTQRYRQFIFSLDLDWNHLNTRSKALKILFHGLNFIKIPFPAIEFNSRGRFKGYWIYF
jgi:hypothetical protein